MESDAVNYLEELLLRSKWYGCVGRINNSSIQILRSMLGKIQTGTFTIENFDACTLPKALIQGYENNWGNFARDKKSLFEENPIPFESLLP